MSIKTELIDYHQKIRSRTNKVLEVIPPDKVNWSYHRGKFTIGDLLRHIAAVERYMYIETSCDRPSLYHTHDRSLAPDLASIKVYMQKLHQESAHILRAFSEEDFYKKCTGPTKMQITRWKWLRAMFEHEIHHRGQLYIYLNLLGIETPPMFDLNAEDLKALGTIT